VSDIIKMNAWGKNIALVAKIKNTLRMELQDSEHEAFSPIAFEESLSLSSVLYRNLDVHTIGLIADSISGDYGKSFYNKYCTSNDSHFPSITNMLSFIGSHGLGAIEYEPADEKANINENSLFFSLEEFKQKSTKILENKRIDDELSKLIARSNASAGGAKAKAVVQFDANINKVHISQKHDEVQEGFVKAIMKFNTKSGSEAQEYNNELKLEYIYYLLARECGLRISDSWLRRDEDNHFYFITKRFDVDESGERLHLHSLAGLLSHNASSFTLGYEMLVRVAIALSVSKEDKEQIFKNIVFNILFCNKDDHSRNFSFLMSKDYEWRYAPSYDLTYSGVNKNLRYHQLTIGEAEINSIGKREIMLLAKLCAVDKPMEIVKQMIQVRDTKLKGLVEEYDINGKLIDMLFEDIREAVDIGE